MMKWKHVVIDGLRLNYKISDTGIVINTKLGVRLKGDTNKKGYYRVHLTDRKSGFDKRIRLHRLVAIMFIPNPNNYPEVNHIDGNKNNNCVDNLEWCDARYNKEHAWRNGFIRNIRKGSDHPMAKHSEEQIREVCELLDEGILSCKNISERTGISVAIVRQISRGNLWSNISQEYYFNKKNKKSKFNIRREIDLSLLKEESKTDTLKRIADRGISIEWLDKVYDRKKNQMEQCKKEGYVFVMIDE